MSFSCASASSTFIVSLALGTSLSTLPVPMNIRAEFLRFGISPNSFCRLTFPLSSSTRFSSSSVLTPFSSAVSSKWLRSTM